MNTLIRTKAPHSATAPRQLNETASKQAVEIEHLRKTYGTLVAVDDVSFSVAEGEILGILGPNGAGKTTTVECAIGLRTPDSGTIRLMGLDPQADRDKVHEIVGCNFRRAPFRPSSGRPPQKRRPSRHSKKLQLDTGLPAPTRAPALSSP
jgi:ABC-type oligopeptide transport system ATPase subunit